MSSGLSLFALQDVLRMRAFPSMARSVPNGMINACLPKNAMVLVSIGLGRVDEHAILGLVVIGLELGTRHHRYWSWSVIIGIGHRS